MKKIVSAILVVLMILSAVCMSVSAAEPTVLVDSERLTDAKAGYEITPTDVYAQGGFDVLSYVAEASMDPGCDKLMAADPVYTFTTAKTGMTVYIHYYVESNVGGMTLFLRQNNQSFDKIDSSVGVHTLAFKATMDLTSLVVYLKNETAAAGSIKVLFGGAEVREGWNPITKVNKTVHTANDLAVERAAENWSVSFGMQGGESAVLVSDVAALTGLAAFDDPESTTDKVVAIANGGGNFMADTKFQNFYGGHSYIITVNLYATGDIDASVGMHMMFNGYTNDFPYGGWGLSAGVNTITFVYTAGAQCWNFGIHHNSVNTDETIYLGNIEIVELDGNAASEGVLTGDALPLLGVYTTTWTKSVVPGTTTPAMKVSAAGIATAYNRVATDENALYAWDGMDCAHRKVVLNYYVANDMTGLLIHNAGGMLPMPCTQGYHSYEIPTEILDDDYGYFNLFTCDGIENASDVYVISLETSNDYEYTGEVYDQDVKAGKVIAKNGTKTFVADASALSAANVYLATMTYRTYTLGTATKGVIAMGENTAKFDTTTGLHTVDVTVFGGAANVTVTAPANTVVVLDKITYTVAGKELGELMSTMNDLQKDIVLDANIATTVELAIADLKTVIEDTLGADYEVISVELADAENAFAKAEKETAALTLRASAADGKLIATVTIKNLVTGYTYTTDLSFTIGTNAGVTASLPTGDAFTAVVIVSLVALIALAGVMIAKKKIHD